MSDMGRRRSPDRNIGVFLTSNYTKSTVSHQSKTRKDELQAQDGQESLYSGKTSIYLYQHAPVSTIVLRSAALHIHKSSQHLLPSPKPIHRKEHPPPPTEQHLPPSQLTHPLPRRHKQTLRTSTNHNLPTIILPAAHILPNLGIHKTLPPLPPHIPSHNLHRRPAPHRP